MAVEAQGGAKEEQTRIENIERDKNKEAELTIDTDTSAIDTSVFNLNDIYKLSIEFYRKGERIFILSMSIFYFVCM